MATKAELEDKVKALSEEIAFLNNELKTAHAETLQLEVMLDELKEDNDSLSVSLTDAESKASTLEKVVKNLRKSEPDLSGDYVVLDGKRFEILARHATKEFVNQIRLQYIPDNTTCVALKREGE